MTRGALANGKFREFLSFAVKFLNSIPDTPKQTMIPLKQLMLGSFERIANNVVVRCQEQRDVDLHIEMNTFTNAHDSTNQVVNQRQAGHVV